MNAITLLKEDHKKMLALLGELETTTPRAIKTRTGLVKKIAHELAIHTRIEEEIFYPALRAVGTKADETLYFEAMEEHYAVEDLVLPHLQGTDPAAECFSGRAKVLRELIEHHAKEEEREMFPRMQALLSLAELRELGARMAQRKAELLAPAAAPELGERLLDTLVSIGSPMSGALPQQPQQ